MGKSRMGKEKKALAAFLLGMAGILAADFWIPDRFFSETENRTLAQKPAFSIQGWLDGSYQKNYEAYVTDQFPWRDRWIAAKTGTQRLSGKKDSNGVYFAPQNTLVERHTQESVDTGKAERKVRRMMEQAQKIQDMVEGRVGVMLVPSAEAVQVQRLPAFAAGFDQAGWIRQIQKQAAQTGILAPDALSSLAAHGGEEIYYGSDHHWTTLGAFYGYQAFAESFGLSSPSLAEYERTVVKEDFWGTLQAKVNLPVRPDKMEVFARRGEGEHETAFVYEDRREISCYFGQRLGTKDAYAFFLDGNYPVVRICGDGAQDRSILLIKDSYANCFAPFLTRDYKTIWLVDPRYYRRDLAEAVAEYAPTDVLYLYNFFQFVENY